MKQNQIKRDCRKQHQNFTRDQLAFSHDLSNINWLLIIAIPYPFFFAFNTTQLHLYETKTAHGEHYMTSG